MQFPVAHLHTLIHMSQNVKYKFEEDLAGITMSCLHECQKSNVSQTILVNFCLACEKLFGHV